MEQEKPPRLANPNTPAILLGNNTALDFLNSIASPVDVPVEWLGSGAALIGWLRQTDLVPEDALRALSDKADLGELDAVAGRARALREWFRGFVLKHRGNPLSQAVLEDLQPINRILARDERYGQIALDANAQETPSPLVWVEKRRWQTSELATYSNSEINGPVGFRRRFHSCEGMRRARMQFAIPRHNPAACKAVVQHGNLREQGEGRRI